VWLPIKRAINASQITTFEAQAGKKVGAEIFYTGWYVNAWSDVQRQINVWEPLGIKTMVVWEPTLKNNGNPLTAILSGSQDAIIDDFARQARTYGRPFFLRFAHEMNGNWYGWGGALSGNNPQLYIDSSPREPPTPSGCGHPTGIVCPTNLGTLCRTITQVTPTWIGSASIFSASCGTTYR
jgi:hypothetical protein